MKTWSLTILAAFALVAGAASAQSRAPGSPPAPAAAKGTVNIVCNPSCDDVVIGGRSYGPSPVVRAELPAGTYEATLKRKSQADTRKQFVVTAGQTASLNFALNTQASPTSAPADVAARVAALRKIPDGWIAIQCDPSCDDVIVDGKRSLGKNPTNVALAPGEHELTAKLKGNADKVVKVRVVEGQTSAVRLSLGTVQIDAVAMRKLLDAKIIAGTATIDEAKMLRAICSQLGDKTCVAKIDTRLKAAPSR